jgi:hypothetical protein
MQLALQVQLQIGLEPSRIESDKIFNLRMKLALQVQLQDELELCRVESDKIFNLRYEVHPPGPAPSQP